MQGAYVHVYVNEDDEIVAVEEVKSVFLTGDFDATKMEFETEDVTYDVKAFSYDNLNTKDVTETLTPAGFTNGKQVADFAKADATDVVIAAKVSGKTIKEIYSVANWNGNTSKATATTVKNIEKNDYLTSTVKFPMNDSKEVDYTKFVLLGVDDVTEIEKDDVLTVYKHTDNYITKLEVCDDVVEGKVSKITSDAKKITVAGKVYEMYNDSTFSIAAGDEVKLTMTYAGDVFEVEKVTGEADEYAIVVKTQLSDSSKIDSTDAKIKLFLADGTEKVFVVDEDEITNFGTLAEGIATVGAVVKYDLNSSDKVVALAEVTASAVDTTVKIDAKGYLGGAKMKIADDAVIFASTTVSATQGNAILTEMEADEDYTVSAKAKLLDSVIAKVAYVVDADTDEIVFMAIDTLSTSDNVYGVVSEKYSVDTEAGYEVVVMMNGEEKAFGCDSATKYGTFDVASSAALRVFKFDANGYLDSAVAASSVGAVENTTSVSAVKIENGRIKGGSVNALIAEDVVVYVYDAEESVWTLGDTSDFVEIEEITVVMYATEEDVNSDNYGVVDYVVVY